MRVLKAISIFSLLVASISATVLAETITLFPAVDGSAEDRTDATVGIMRDGVFETFFPQNEPDLRTFNGITIEQRAAMEFNLASIPASAKITAANLLLSMTARSGDVATLAVYGFPGDGLITTSDFSAGSPVFGITYPFNLGLVRTPIPFDVTTFVNGLSTNQFSFAAFSLRVDAGNGLDFASKEWPEPERIPRLEIQYTIPEPPTLSIAIIAVLASWTLRYRAVLAYRT